MQINAKLIALVAAITLSTLVFLATTTALTGYVHWASTLTKNELLILRVIGLLVPIIIPLCVVWRQRSRSSEGTNS